MPSAIQKRSYGSVTVYCMDEEAVRSALQRFVAELAERPDVLAVVLFGSLARGRAGVGSDVDVLVVLSHSDRPFLDRTALYRPDHFPVDIDVFPYTLAEIRRGQPLAREALDHGQVLWQRTQLDVLLHGSK